MGIGYTLIVRPDAAATVLKALRKLGEKPILIGVVDLGAGEARIVH